MLTTLALLAPLALAFAEILRLAARFPPPGPDEPVPGSSPEPDAGGDPGRPLRGLDRPPSARADLPRHPVWGVERPALETWASILAFAPLVGWLGNPAWWRETMPRLAHYYLLNTDRRGSLPDIRILYLGQTYSTAFPGTTPGS